MPRIAVIEGSFAALFAQALTHAAVPKLLIISSHPIQYQVPWFRALHKDERIELTVLFLAIPSAEEQGVGFDRCFEWDIPLLEGYNWRLAESATGGIGKGYFGLRVNHARKELRGIEHDLVLLTGWQYYGMLQCLRAAVASPRPVLVRAESSGLKPMGLLHRVRARLGLAGVDRFLPIGKSNELFYEKIGVGRRVGQSVPYFVDNRFFQAGVTRLSDQRMALRKKFGIPQQSTCFVFSGKFIEKKRPGHALEALGKLAAKLPGDSVHLLMVGSGELESALMRQVSERALPVSFAGFLNQSEMPAAYAASDCLVLPSDYGETWGLVVNEAMACGLPVIVSDRVGCGPDLVRAGQTGFQYTFGDTTELAACMRQFFSLSTADRKLMANHARELVSGDYSVDRAAENTVQAVLSVLA